MKLIITLCLLFLSIIFQAQSRTVSGILKDKETNLPVESVTISVENSAVGTISNEDGKFRITLPNANSRIFITHIYYNPVALNAGSTDQEMEVFLEPQTFELQEVLVNKIPAKTMLAEAVAMSKSKLQKSLLLNTYYREFVNVDNKFTSFSDGLVDYYVKRKSGASDLQVKQSRVFDLKDENASERQKAIQSINLNDIQEAIEYGYNFKGVNNIMKNDDYNFYSETKKLSDGKIIDVVSIEPKDGVEKEMMFQGSVTFDSKSKLILEVNLEFSPEHKKYSEIHNILIAKFKVNDYARKSKYKVDGEKYVLVYYQSKADIYLKFGNKINNTFQSTCDLTTLNYKEGEFKIDKDRKYKARSLFENGNKFTEEFWKKYDVMLLSDKEERLLKTLQQ